MANESDQNSTEETQNDDVVGSAIRWSLGIIAALLSAGALLWALTRKPPEPVVVKAGPTTLPTERVTPALEIPEVRFTEITDTAGIDFVHTNGAEGEKLLPETMGGGGGFFDFDNDGDQDLLWVTAVAGVAGGENDWSTSCGWLDFDNDGDLDLFVCNYIQWNRELDQSMEFTLDGKLRAYGRPTDFTGAFPFLYRNEGNGTFVDVSDAAGVQIRDLNTNVPLSKSLGTTFCDVNADGLLDILVANDTVQNLLFLNQPGGTFIETAATAGIAFDNSGGARGAMGIDTACFRNSDAVGIAIGNFATEMTALYVCQTPGATIPIFRDEAVSNGIGPVTRTDLKFGILFIDADLDGRLDLFENNGHLEEDIKVVQASQQYEQPPHLLWNCGTEFDNEFIMLPEAKTGADFQKRMVGRGAAMADIDADGDLDLILFSSGGKPRLLRNDQKSGHHWLRLRLRGTKCNKDAIGAVVNVTLPNSTVLSRTVMPTRSYQSQTELPVTFGLGSAEIVKEIAIRWPDGTSQKLSGISVDQQLEVIQKP